MRLSFIFSEVLVGLKRNVSMVLSCLLYTSDAADE